MCKSDISQTIWHKMKTLKKNFYRVFGATWQADSKMYIKVQRDNNSQIIY